MQVAGCKMQDTGCGTVLRRRESCVLNPASHSVQRALSGLLAAGALLLGLAGCGGGGGLSLFSGGEARYAILLTTIGGYDHAREAAEYKRQLQEGAGMKEVWLDEGPEATKVLYGRYFRRDSEEARKDLERIHRLQTAQGRLAFPLAVLYPLPDLTAPPPAPPAWDLTNAPGLYALQIAVFYDLPDYREQAVRLVRELRKEEVEAYYHHDSLKRLSAVCVGSFRRGADRQDPQTGRFLDPEVASLQERFPHCYENGEVVTIRFHGKEEKQSSLLVNVPPKESEAEPGEAYGPDGM